MLGQAVAASMAVHEAMRDPFAYPLVTYAWVIACACAGGIANFVAKVKAGDARAFNVAELVGEMFISGFVGLITFWLCEYANIDKLLSAVFIGISGHMGSRALFAAERYASRYFEQRTGVTLTVNEERGNGQ